MWTELGYRHPLAARDVPAVRAPDDRLLVIPGTPASAGALHLGPGTPASAGALHLDPGTPASTGAVHRGADDATAWFTLPAAGWRGLDAALELVVPDKAIVHTAGALPARRRIELRLAGGRREPPSLWVVRTDGVAAIDQLLRYLPEDVIARLAFAVSSGDAPVVIVRARIGRTAAPELAIANAEAYAPLAQMPDVYAPAAAVVEPPLRRERLRQILGVAPGEVMWLARAHESPSPGSSDASVGRPDRDAGAFRAERIADAAFAPMSEWADYVIHANAPALVPWMRATELDFTPYIASHLEWGAAEAKEPDGPDKPRVKQRAGRVQAIVEAPATPRPVRAAPRAAANEPASAAAESPAAYVAIDEELAALETEFVALDAPADAPERLELLARLGVTYARLGRRRDAGLCFARAVWEASATAAPARLDAWLAADLRGTAADVALARVLAQGKPAADDVRLVAALRRARRRASCAIRIACSAGSTITTASSTPHAVARAREPRAARGGDVRWPSRMRAIAFSDGSRAGCRSSASCRVPALRGRTGALGTPSGEHLRDALDELATRFGKTRASGAGRRRGRVDRPRTSASCSRTATRDR